MVRRLKRRSQQAKIPAQIHVLDHLTDRIIHTLDNKAGRIFWDDEHLNTLQDESVYDFITRYNNSEALKGRNRLIIPSEGGEFYHELIIDETIKQEDTKEVYSTASYLDLRKAKVIAPRSFESTMLHIMANVALGGTEWALGRVENDGQRSLTLDGYTNPYRMLRRIETLFEMEIRFRIETKNGRVIGRYVDFLQQRGEWRGKEVTLGKDLIGVTRKENTEDVISALVVVGPTYEDENDETQQIVTEVTDEEARQRWSRTGAHVWDYHEPETDDENITESRLQTIGRTELNRRITASVTYEADTVSIEDVFGLEHEKTRLGDTVRVKDTSYEPPLYMEARVFSIRRSIADPSRKVYDLGDFVEMDEADIYDIQRRLEVKIASRVSRRRLEEYAEKKRVVSDDPPDDPDVIWEDPTQTPHVFSVYNGEEWVKATPTLPGEVGAYGKDEVDQRIEAAEDAVNEASRRYTENFYTEEIEVDIQRARDYTDEEVSNRADEIRSDLYDAIDGVSADIDDVDSSLSQRIADRAQEIRDDLGTQKTELQNEISNARNELSDSLSDLNSDLTEEINKKIEAGDVDEAISGLVRTVDYEEDQQGQINRFESNETKIEQTEEEISQQAQRIEQTEDDLSEARTSINQNADAIELKAEDSRVNELEGTLQDNTAEIRAVSDAVEIRVTEDRLQESIDDIEIGARNLFNLSDVDTYSPYNTLEEVDEEERSIITEIVRDTGASTNFTIRNDPRPRDFPGADGPSGIYTISGYFFIEGNPLKRSDIRNNTINTQSNSNGANTSRFYVDEETGYFNITEERSASSWVFHCSIEAVPGDIIEVRDLKVEKGTKATDWTPAQEDTTRQFERVESSIETEAGRIELESRRISDLGEDLSDTNARITVLDDEIELRAEKTTVDNIEGDISSINTSLSLQADEIAAKASQSEVDDLSGTVSDAQAELSLQADEIAAKASQSEVDDLTGNLSDTRSELRLLSDEVDIRVTEDRLQESIDDIEIGGRNLIVLEEFSSFSAYASIESIEGDTITLNINRTGSTNIAIRSDAHGLETGQTYTVSGYGKINGESITDDFFINPHTRGTIDVQKQFVNPETGYFEYQMFAEGNYTYFMHASTNAVDGDTVIFEQMKFEKGSKATDWTPAPEDTEEKLERNEASINAVSDEVSIEARRITEMGDDLSDARSEINALAGEVEIKASQTEVNDIEGRLEEAESSLRVLPDEIDAKVSVDEIITQINLSSEGVRIEGDRNRITGQTEIDNAVITNAMIDSVHGGKIIADSVTATQMNIADLSAITANLGSVTAGELTAVDLYGSSFQMSGNGYRMDISDGRILTRDTSGSRERRALLDTATLYLFEVDGNGLPTSPDMSITPNRIRARPDLIIEANSIELDGGNVLRMSNGTSIDNTGGNPRVQRDTSRYILQTANHIDFYQAAENSSNRTFRFGTDSSGGWHHRTMVSGNGTLKFLNGGTDAIQFRNDADTAYIRLQASEFITGSMRDTKENIKPYTKSVLDRIKDTQIYTYKLRSEKFDNMEDRYKLGMIYEEAPRFLKNSGGGINHYGAIATLWKAIQELTVKIETLEAEKEGLTAA